MNEQYKFILDAYDEIPPTPRSAIKTSPKHRRMLTLFGKDKSGNKCKDCAYLERVGHAGKNYYKCLVSGSTSSAASDWRLKWAACGKFRIGR